MYVILKVVLFCSKVFSIIYRRSDQKSKPIYLENGKKYYIEGLVVEKGGGDHLSVAVTLPSGQQSKPLDGYYLVDNAD